MQCLKIRVNTYIFFLLQASCYVHLLLDSFLAKSLLLHYLSHSYAGLTNPPSVPTLREVPYPSPDYYTGAYKVSWELPLLKGGLSTLNYNITIKSHVFTGDQVLTSDTHSVVAYIEYNEGISVTITVVDIDYESDISFSRQLSETSPEYINERLISECAGRGNETLAISA